MKFWLKIQQIRKVSLANGHGFYWQWAHLLDISHAVFLFFCTCLVLQIDITFFQSMHIKFGKFLQKHWLPIGFAMNVPFFRVFQSTFCCFKKNQDGTSNLFNSYTDWKLLWDCKRIRNPFPCNFSELLKIRGFSKSSADRTALFVACFSPDKTWGCKFRVFKKKHLTIRALNSRVVSMFAVEKWVKHLCQF